MPHNRVTIYSNGIADLQRFFPVSQGTPQTIMIPVRQSYLADVLASLTISGKVTVSRPPSYQPAHQGDHALVISGSESLLDLVRQLVGAEVELTIAQQTHRGRLMGIQSEEIGGKGESITQQNLVLLTPQGIRHFPAQQMENLQFLDETILSEITQALNRHIREIKPDSTVIEFALTTQKKSTPALIQYTIPAAAWKISYRIIVKEGVPLELQGHAIVDNNSDEDWKDFVVAVVVGQPITFSTDLADIKIPRRNHVDVVQDSAFGAVEVESAMDAEIENRFQAGPEVLQAAAPLAGKMPMAAKKMRRRQASAEIASAQVSETGDFCIFESPHPVSIDAGRSAMIPVFQTDLDDSHSVLHYQWQNHPERPYRAIQFRNTTGNSLGRGVCTVYEEATYIGSCMLPATPREKELLLPHALETSVRVRRESGKIESRRVGIRISDGVAHESYHKLLRTEYLINSHHDASFPFILDHEETLSNAKIDCQILRKSEALIDVDAKKLSSGYRIAFELRPHDVVRVVVIETSVARSRVRLTGDGPGDGDLRVTWLYDNLIDSNRSLIQDPAITRCIELQKELDDRQAQIAHAQQEIQRLTKRQQRLRENLKTGGDARQGAKWQDALAQAEDHIVQIEDEHLPHLISERDQCRRELYNALNQLVIDWSE